MWTACLFFENFDSIYEKEIYHKIQNSKSMRHEEKTRHPVPRPHRRPPETPRVGSSLQRQSVPAIENPCPSLCLYLHGRIALRLAFVPEPRLVLLATYEAREIDK